MALETEINPGDLVLNGNYLLDSGQVVIYNDPLMFYEEEHLSNDCSFVFDPLSNESNLGLPLQELVLDSNYFQVDSRSCDSNSLLQNEDITFQFLNQTQANEGLPVLQVFYNNNSPNDQPEFVDVNNLTGTDYFKNPSNDCIAISDDDDVIYVGEFQTEQEKRTIKIPSRLKKEENIRRNPVRKARSSKASRDLAKELIFEEDFAFLDQSDEENMVFNKKNSSSSCNENFKQWPVNVHERPAYNAATKKIENFDFSIKQTVSRKKPRLETVPIRRKSKKKYFVRKRNPRKVVEKKLLISELRLTVNSTFDSLKDFLKNCEIYERIFPRSKSKDEISAKDADKWTLIENQTILLSIVNDLNQTEITEKLNELRNATCDTKE